MPARPGLALLIPAPLHIATSNPMEQFSHFKRQIKYILFLLLGIESLILLAGWWLGSQIFHLGILALAFYLIVLGLSAAVGLAILSVSYIVEPVRFIWQAVMHVSPAGNNITAPAPEQLNLGRELITTLCTQVYQLSSLAKQPAAPTASDQLATAIVKSLPSPLFAMNKNRQILFTNDAAGKYLGITPSDILHKDMYSLLDLSFSTIDTFDTWLTTVRNNSVTASKNWERVRLKLPDHKTSLQFDMAAHYNRAEQDQIETIVALFDRNDSYQQDDDSLSFMALTVHELRTPLTLVRGYIESLQDELGPELTGEKADILHKLEASASQLSAFVNNILNVARVDANQLILQLDEGNWSDIVKTVVADLGLRAQTHQITIECQLAPDLPAVAADRTSIYEVLANLLDNAIKYSPEGQKVIVKTSLNQNGLIETSVQDFGPGIPLGVIPHLFEKFYRNHQTKGQVSGTGLGLYLCKAIMTAHGGNIWVRSKEGQGTIIGFTLLPYSQLAEERKNNDNKGITRVANGWIKNHSLYRQ